MNDKFWLERKNTVLVVVDVQQKLVPAMDEEVCNRLIGHINILVEACRQMGVPVIATEQYPRGLGHTIDDLTSATTENCIEKTAFSCWGEPAFVEALEKTGAKQVLLTGMEAHVCVYQTMSDLLDQGYSVHLVRDAICSRFKSDYKTAVSMAPEMGAVLTTTEMALFQMLRKAGGDDFKLVSKLVRGRKG